MMKWKTALLVLGAMMITTGTQVSSLAARADFHKEQHNGKLIAIGPVCTRNGPCGSGNLAIVAGPVCYPDEPCGPREKIVAAGPTCTPNGPCGSGGTRS